MTASNFKLVIAGTRSFMPGSMFSHADRAEQVDEVVSEHFDPEMVDRVISGGARGGDAAGEAWAAINDIPIQIYHVADGYNEEQKQARWEHLREEFGAEIDVENVASFGDYGPGPVDRNAMMVADADAFLAFYDGQSTGTGSAIAIARGEHDSYDVDPLPTERVVVHRYR